MQDVEKDLRPTIEYLRSLKYCKVHRVREHLPAAVFAPGNPGRMMERVNYLSETLGVGANRVGIMITRWPNVLTMSQSDTIDPKARARRASPPPSAAAAARRMPSRDDE